MKEEKRIAILGGGPGGLFIFKRLVECGDTDFSITIFERKHQLGSGMPYSTDGANEEHITNVSGNEIPALVTSIAEWIKTVPQQTLKRFHIDPEKFNDYKVLPRLLFGEYLEAQFKLLQQQAKASGMHVQLHLGVTVKDIIDQPEENMVLVETDKAGTVAFDHVIICTGHNWPVKQEGTVPGYFDSPYPPAKLAVKINYPVAIRGASLTAIDAIRTLAKHNGIFSKDKDGKLSYHLADDSPGFRLMMHSRNGLLPAVRFHLEDSHLAKDSVLSQEEINANRERNDGFLSLDYVFEKNFKEAFREKEPAFYEQVKHMRIEEFVEAMMELRERVAPFDLFKAEYAEAEKSIKRKESVYWKEMLAVLSFAMNYPAKYFSAEDMLRLQKVLMPLIAVVIAFVPQDSVEELLALYNAGILDITAVGDDSHVAPEPSGGAVYHYIDASNKPQAVHYKMFVDCIGQPHLSSKDLPYKSLLTNQTVSPAMLRFRDAAAGLQAMENGNEEVTKDAQGSYYLNVPGITINDHFQLVDKFGAYNERIFIMAVPYIGGYNPDYSGLDFCEAASAHVIAAITKHKLVS